MMSNMVLIFVAAMSMAMAAPPLEKESHDEAYNSIISQYYTTDPFFAKDMAGSRSNVADRRSSSSSPLPREKIPAPLLARSEKPPTAPTRPRKVRSSLFSSD